MEDLCILATRAFSITSIIEVDTVIASQLDESEEQSILIESFRQPFPLRERGKTVVDGEMDPDG
jgi:hypothetical protein